MAPKERASYLNNSNYHLALEENHVACFHDKVVLGRIEVDETNGRVKFNKKSIFLPSRVFKNFSECLDRAHRSFQTIEEGSEIPSWSKLLYKFSSIHHVVAMFGKYEDSEPCFKILVRWNYQKDRQYQKLVESGERDPVANTSEEQGGWIWLKRGAYLHQAEVEILHAQWLSVLEHSLNPSSNSKSRVLDFINFVISSDTHRLFVQEKLEGYDRLNFKAKIKMLNHLLNHFYEEKNLDKEGSFHLKNYLDVLACHTLVIFPLLFWHLRAQE